MSKIAPFGVRPLEEFRCAKCGERYPHWEDFCFICLQPALEVVESTEGLHRKKENRHRKSVRASDCIVHPIKRLSTGRSAWDEALGGGFVYPSSTLIYGQAGIGKSSMLLAVATHMADALGGDVLYGSAEMPRNMIVQAADRMHANKKRLLVYDESDAVEFLAEVERVDPVIAVWDSVQAFHWEGEQNENALTRVFKSAIAVGLSKKISIMLISQVNKAGDDFTGLNHMRHDVDSTVRMLLSRADKRMVRVDKHRYGPAPVEACDE